MGSAVGGLISGGLGLAGSILGGREQRRGMEAAAESSRFVPTSISTPFGSVDASMGNVSASLPSELQDLYQGLLSSGQQTLAQAETPEAALGFLNRTYGPELERQRLSQESRLFNQGLLGTTTGGLQTEAVNRAQNQALLDATLGAQQQFQSQGLGLLGSALDVANLPQSLIALSGNIGAQQASAGAQAGRFTAQAADARGRSINSIFSGLGQSIGSFVGNQPTQQPLTQAQGLMGGTFLPNTSSAFSGTGSFPPPPQFQPIGGFGGTMSLIGR